MLVKDLSPLLLFSGALPAYIHFPFGKTFQKESTFITGNFIIRIFPVMATMFPVIAGGQNFFLFLHSCHLRRK